MVAGRVGIHPRPDGDHNVSDEVGLQMAELDWWTIVVAHQYSLRAEGHNDAGSLRSNQLREIP